MSEELVVGEYKALSKRKLSEETCRKWGYSQGTYKGKPVQIANYTDAEGHIVAQKLRHPNKDFKWIGKAKEVQLFGRHLWGQGGKIVVVTEGEIDAMSLSQVQQHKWPVVSIPSGANGAKKALQNHLEWLESFETVILMFDMDESGREASAECAELFTPSKCKIASLPLKDPNECLLARKEEELVRAIWNAKEYRPDGIVDGREMWESIITPEINESIPYPWDGMNKILLGIRQAELTTFTAGTGIGKSQICRELAHHILSQKKTIGYIALEESVKRTMLGVLSIELNKPLHLLKIEELSKDDVKKAFDDTVGSGRFFAYDHFGSMDTDNLLAKIRYLARGKGCTHIILDHISIVVSGIEDGDERRMIDNTMTKLRQLVQELNISLFIVSHLKRPEGKSHEEGAETSLSQLRGSGAIGQISDNVVGLERNQQDPVNKHRTTLRVLKNRFSGETGKATTLLYTPETGRLSEDVGMTVEELESHE